MLRATRLTLSAVMCLGVGVVGTAQVQAQAQAANPEVSWNLSVWGPPRAFTAGIEELAKHVESGSGGKFKIKIHYGDSLSKASDNLDNIKLGAFAMAQICTGYHPGIFPVFRLLIPTCTRVCTMSSTSTRPLSKSSSGGAPSRSCR